MGRPILPTPMKPIVRSPTVFLRSLVSLGSAAAGCDDGRGAKAGKASPKGGARARMDFGILFTSHPNTDIEPYPHREVHDRVTREILRADEIGFDIAWIAEHHFSNQYGIMPDVFVYAGYLAALTKRIRIGTAVVTLPLANPLRVAENAAFVDILSNGRFTLGLGSGYRQYEFDGFGVDFEARRDIQEEALPLLMDMLRSKRVDHRGKHFRVKVDN